MTDRRGFIATTVLWLATAPGFVLAESDGKKKEKDVEETERPRI